MEKYEQFLKDYIAMAPEDRKKLEPVKIVAAILIVSASKMERAFEMRDVNALISTMESVLKASSQVEEMLTKLLVIVLREQMRGMQGAVAPRAQIAGPTHAEDVKPEPPLTANDKKAEEMLANIFSGLTQPGKA